MQRKRYNVLLDLITSNNYESMVEIGVGKGEVLLHLIKELDMDGFVWDGVDPYKTYDEYVNDINGTSVRVKQNMITILNILKNYSEKTNMILHTMYSEEAVDLFEDESVDLIFVDGNHSYEYVKQDIELWWLKVKMFGCLAFHDYDRPKMFPGVKKAVNEFIQHMDLKLRKDSDIVYTYKV